jgi:gas vesicle protein
MAKDRTSTGLIVGLAVGIGLGLAAALLLDPNSGSRRRTQLIDRARDVADRVASLTDGAGTWRQRKTERAARTVQNRVERIRSAGL